jgi:hypothetical protein
MAWRDRNGERVRRSRREASFRPTLKEYLPRRPHLRMLWPMPAPNDPVSDLVACLLAIIEGLCGLLAEHAAREAGAGVRAHLARRATEQLRRLADDIATAAPHAAAPADASPAPARPSLRARRRTSTPSRRGTARRHLTGARRREPESGAALTLPHPRAPPTTRRHFHPQHAEPRRAPIVPISR